MQKFSRMLRSALSRAGAVLDRCLQRCGPVCRPIARALNRDIASSWATRTDRLIEDLSVTEKILFYVFVLLLIASSGYLAFSVYTHSTEIVPARGGTLVEGVVGSPRFINPLLASSDADKDLSSLVYAGLLKTMPDGRLVYDLARDIKIGTSSRRYTVTLKKDITFHDGKPVTARDVAFTVRQAQNSQLRSPIQGNWSGVDTEIIDRRTVRFTLDEPYSPFLQNLTLGILPAHIWQPLPASRFPSSPHNDARPIGAGPYRVTNFDRDADSALATYTLEPFQNYALGQPYLEELVIRSFRDTAELTAALREGEIDSAGGLNTGLADQLRTSRGADVLRTAHLPRLFAVFFNQNQKDIFADQALREVLASVIDKRALIEQTVRGYATPVHSPIPAELAPAPATTTDTGFSGRPEEVASSSLSLARSQLTELGWTAADDSSVRSKDGTTLSFSLATTDTPELVRAAKLLRDRWKQIGVEVSVEVYSSNNLNRDVIRPRKYDALLFGEIIGRGRDFYPFWHSSQQTDPGLNVAQYANITADSLLEDIRRTHQRARQDALIKKFAGLVAAEQPAIFLYTPHYIYTLPPTIRGVRIAPVTTPHARFNTVHRWYQDTKRVWHIFSDATHRPAPRAVFPSGTAADTN